MKVSTALQIKFFKPAVLLNASESLENVKLGIFIVSDLKWPSHVQIQLNKARKVFSLLGIGSFSILPPKRS